MMSSQQPWYLKHIIFHSAELTYFQTTGLEQSGSISLGQRQEYPIKSYSSKNYAERMRKKTKQF